MGGMATTHAPTRLTNVALGQLLGLDHSSASRLRRGERGCSVAVMLRIEDLFRWSVREQHTAFQNGTFARELEHRISLYGDSLGPAGKVR